jgi:hypothetical protein
VAGDALTGEDMAVDEIIARFRDYTLSSPRIASPIPGRRPTPLFSGGLGERCEFGVELTLRRPRELSADPRRRPMTSDVGP